MDTGTILAILVMAGTYGFTIWCAWSEEGIRYLRLHLPPFYEKWLRRTKKTRFPDRVFRVGLHQGKRYSYLVSIQETRAGAEISIDIFQTRSRFARRIRPLCLKRYRFRAEI